MTLGSFTSVVSFFVVFLQLCHAVDTSVGGHQQSGFHSAALTLEHDGERGGSLLRREALATQSRAHDDDSVSAKRVAVENRPALVATAISGERPLVVSMSGVPSEDNVALVTSWLQYWQSSMRSPPGNDKNVTALLGSDGNVTDNELTIKAPAAINGDPELRRYLSFETDGGGFNNIRMAFEYFVSLAALSGRTLVLPAPEGWYLIDWGSRNAHGTNYSDQEWISSGTNSTYQEFWDMESLRSRGMSILSADEFYGLERERMNMVDSARPAAVVVNQPDESPWKRWLRSHAGVLAHTCKDGVDKSLAASPQLVHIPYRSEDTNPPTEYRFLDCDPRKSGEELLHYHPKLFDLAAIPVAKLGIGRFAALHLRRNDFQYTQAPGADGVQTLVASLEGYLKPQEPVYVASDEVDVAWWDNFRTTLAKKGHELFTLHSFNALFASHNVSVSERHSGIVEQLVCVGARVFIGTPLSTYTSGIQDVRQRLARARDHAEASTQQHNASDAEKETDGVLAYHAERLLAKI